VPRQTTITCGRRALAEAFQTRLDCACVMARAKPTAKVFFEVRVPLVTVEERRGKSFALYMINVSYDSNSWPVSRRFSEFDELASTLRREGGSVPALPTKLGIGRNQLGKVFLESRRQALEVFLRRILGDSSESGLEGSLRPPWAVPPVDRFLSFSANALSSTLFQLEDSPYAGVVVEMLKSEGVIRRPGGDSSRGPVEDLFEAASKAAAAESGRMPELETAEVLLRQTVGAVQDRVETIRSFTRALGAKEEAFMDVLTKTHIKIDRARDELKMELRRREVLRDQVRRDAEAEFRAAVASLAQSLKLEQLRQSLRGVLWGHSRGFHLVSSARERGAASEDDSVLLTELGVSRESPEHHHRSQAWTRTLSNSHPRDERLPAEVPESASDARAGLCAALESARQLLRGEHGEGRPSEQATKRFGNFQGEAVRLLCLVDRLACVK
jgi:hypothetical protein